jgi:glycosyltransferase involved in cell wall biosynthesis
MMARHQILRRLAQRFPVVWVDPPDGWRNYWRPGAARFLERATFASPAPGLTVLKSGLLLPKLHRPAWLRRATLRRRLAWASGLLADRGATDIVLDLWRYEFAEALELCPHSLSCYEIDDEYSFSDVDVPNHSRELELLRRVDQVIVRSPALMDKKGGVNPSTALVPNGVDFRAFSSRREEPEDLRKLPRPRLGYVGVIKRQLDLALLGRLARARPRWSIAVVGPIGNVSGKEQALAELSSLANVHFLGSKPVDALPAYTQHVDVCLMCYEVNDYTRYIYPLKLHEYLASGRPVVSSAIQAALAHADVVAVARSDEEWLAALDRAVEPGALAADAVARRQARARQHDWDALAGRVADLIDARLATKRATRSTPAPGAARAD